MVKIKILFKKIKIKALSILSRSKIIHFFEKMFSKTKSQISSDDLHQIKTSAAKNLIIVAHPDDETIFCGDFLLNNDCFVVCLTHKNNIIRSADFTNVMNLSRSDFLMLNYPDASNGYINNWNKFEKSIYKDIISVILCKEWNKIITHNPYGEYGHIHHKKCSKLTRLICKNNNLTDRLYYFYYDYQKPLKNFESKLALLEIYRVNQPNAVKFLENTAKHEIIVFNQNYKKKKIN